MVAAHHTVKPRTTRVLLQMPLLISGVDAEGNRFETTGESIVVNKNGAEIRCSRALNTDTEIVVTLPRDGRVTQARVIWAQKKPAGLGQHQYGIRLSKSENFWGVYFPPGDWDEANASATKEGRPTPSARKPLPGQPRETEPSLPSVPALAPTPPRPAEVLLPPLEIPARGLEVVVRGVSAARIPFQERCHLRPVNEHEAQIEVHPVVDIGASVHLVFPTENRSLRARTTAVADRQHSARWRMWVSLAEPVKLV